MTQTDKSFLNLPAAGRSKADAKAKLLCRRWQNICERYLPVKSEETIWRFSRIAKEREPSQGWKFHIPATVLNACDIFEKIAPFLISQDLQFKAPKSLDELYKINSGLHYGYWQVGKFMTIYPSSTAQTVELARQLHELTKEFIPISVPFDRQFLPNSSVFYRYGAFASIEMTDSNGITLPAVKNPQGELVYDDRFEPVPEWLSDPFQNTEEIVGNNFENSETPLTTSYKVFRAITQRGKGGTYQALDFSTNPPRFCVVKEGRRHGEAGWNGQDGYYLVKNEFEVLNNLGGIYKDVPQVFSSFEIDENFYFAMEYVEGKSLNDLMKTRQRRFSVEKVIELAVEIAGIIDKIHNAGWIWNDCKPANLIVTRKKNLRPIDFEGSYPANLSDPFDWKTDGFSKSSDNKIRADNQKFSDDLYALGAVVYFLLTGKLYESNAPTAIGKLRRNVPLRLQLIVEKLLSDSALETQLTALEAGKEFERILEFRD